jgi:hypothetical protein
MAKFKCNHSGNVFEFTNEHDIKTMRTHSEYTEVKEETILPPQKAKKVKQDETSIDRGCTQSNG